MVIDGSGDKLEKGLLTAIVEHNRYEGGSWMVQDSVWVGGCANNL